MEMKDIRIWDLLDDMQKALGIAAWLFIGIILSASTVSIIVNACFSTAEAHKESSQITQEMTHQASTGKAEAFKEVAFEHSAGASGDEIPVVDEVVHYEEEVGLTAYEEYLLAKIAMAEAEGESFDCKVHIILVVLNRVHDAQFPDTIEEVIYQNRNGVYQFSPIGDGRWDRVEPNDECWEALEVAKQLAGEITMGALYFESCKNTDNWHSRNLQFLFSIDGTRFYK